MKDAVAVNLELIQLKECGNQVPRTKNLKPSTWNPESTAWNPESNTVLDSPTWRDHGAIFIN